MDTLYTALEYCGLTPAFEPNPLDALIERVKAALQAYDQTNDHAKHDPHSDWRCVRCTLVAALPK